MVAVRNSLSPLKHAGIFNPAEEKNDAEQKRRFWAAKHRVIGQLLSQDQHLLCFFRYVKDRMQWYK